MKPGFEYQGVLRNCSHGPKTWSWWKMFSLSFVKVSNSYLRPEIIAREGKYEGYRLWIYTRSGGRYLEVYFHHPKDSRDPA